MERNDPLAAFCFSLQIADVVPDDKKAFFKSVSGLKNESEVTPFREGGLNTHTHQLVGPSKWPNLVLKRGFAKGGYELLLWRQQWVTEGKLKRKQGKVVQYNSAMEPVCHWRFVDGWPCKWEGPDFDAGKTELAIETLEIAHSGLFFGVGGG